MINTVNKLYDILNAEYDNTLDWADKIFKDKLYNILGREFPKTPFINIEVTSESVEYGINKRVHKDIDLVVQIVTKASFNNNLQIGSDMKNYKGYLEMAKDVKGILKNNVQVSGYWTQLEITGGSQLEISGNNGVLHGWNINLLIKKKCS